LTAFAGDVLRDAVLRKNGLQDVAQISLFCGARVLKFRVVKVAVRDVGRFIGRVMGGVICHDLASWYSFHCGEGSW